jgi:PEP-CTERM motif
MTTRTCSRGLLVAALLVSVGTAFANNVSYVFNLTWQSGALFGTESQGSLSFDDSIALPNAQYLGPDSLTSFGFVAGERIYDLIDVKTGFLFFDSNSDLRLLGVGTDCGPGFCNVSPANAATFYIVYDSQSQLDRFFAVAGGGSDQSYGVGVLQIAPVPEPSSLIILLAGAGLLAVRRQATSNLRVAHASEEDGHLRGALRAAH